MPRCSRHQIELNASGDCLFCRWHIRELIGGPIFQRLLAQLVPAQTRNAMRETALKKLVESCRREPPDPAEDLDPSVDKARQKWRRASGQTTSSTAEMDPFIAFPTLFTIAITARRLAKRYVYATFRHAPRNEPLMLTLVKHQPLGMLHRLSLYEAGLMAGYEMFLQLSMWEFPLDEILAATVRAMKEHLNLSPVILTGLGMESPSHEDRKRATIEVAGWAATQISLRYPRLQKALSNEGQTPFKRLLERLPTATYLGWHGHGREPRPSLRDRIIHELEQSKSASQLGDHLSPESLRKAHHEIRQWDRVSSALEDWQSCEEARRDLDRLSQRAGLSPREAEVLNLKRQGLTQEQIGGRLGITRGAVKKLEERAVQKMQDIA
jgi:RNA polymerase sigma factor (sigma-70 family)